MPLLLLFILAPTVGLATGFLVWRYPRSVAASRPAVEGAQKVGETIGRYGALRRALKARLEPAAATGLALTLALLVAIGGGVLFALLAYLVRSNAHLHGVDNGVAKWGSAHASAFSTDGLNVVTQLGAIYVVIALSIVLAVGLTIIDRSAWVVPFVIAVMGGEEILTLIVKDLADHVRPRSIPLPRRWVLLPEWPFRDGRCVLRLCGAPDQPPSGRPAPAALTGLAVGLAVAVASSRVLLDVHWLSDVIAGLALGWVWFSMSAVAFGGRLLRFGAGAEAAAQAADASARRATASALNRVRLS